MTKVQYIDNKQHIAKQDKKAQFALTSAPIKLRKIKHSKDTLKLEIVNNKAYLRCSDKSTVLTVRIKLISVLKSTMSTH